MQIICKASPTPGMVRGPSHSYFRARGAPCVWQGEHLTLAHACAVAPLYCTPATKALLLRRWPGFAAPLIALEQDEVNVLTLHTAGGPITLNVILLDAHHCLVRAGGKCRVTWHLADTGLADDYVCSCTVLSALSKRFPLPSLDQWRSCMPNFTGSQHSCIGR